ncbi:MAG: plastocyanin/azurin family copper-binding protein [Thermomicrobiales bacterium]|nr:plastocyanin/azurin family copper-binding protein [Thermomicrobiales bacterium]MCO5217330.1 plastocyanin/azurin family copper-binding protein [Thermomicrobiales bacterium]MCO5226178.1 plastocyanin/azurin family copper-binding protein [Thermomicrobiales bacterium]
MTGDGFQPKTRALAVTLGRHRKVLTAVFLGVVLIAVAAFLVDSNDDAPPGGLVFVIPAGASQQVSVPTIDSAIEVPTEIVFNPGEVAAITVINKDTVANRAGPWVIGPGQSYTIRFDKPGTYQFNCAVDPRESVTVLVN